MACDGAGRPRWRSVRLPARVPSLLISGTPQRELSTCWARQRSAQDLAEGGRNQYVSTLGGSAGREAGSARRLGREGGAPIVAGRWRSHGVLGPHRGSRRRPKAATIAEEGKRRRGLREEEGKRTLCCVRCWRREVMGHGPFYCAQRKPANASCVWVGSIGDGLRKLLVLISSLTENYLCSFTVLGCCVIGTLTRSS